MAISVNRNTLVITIPQADLTFVTGTLYELDTEALRLEMKQVEASEEGIVDQDMHRRNAPVTVAGTTFAQTMEIINGFSIEFEDGAYSVRLVGSNNNFFDVENNILVQNSVQVIGQNSAGLIIGNISITDQDKDDIVDKIWDEATSGHNVPGSFGEAIGQGDTSVTPSERLKIIQTIVQGKAVTDPVTGLMTVYDLDTGSPKFRGQMYEDADAAQTYRARGAQRREKLVDIT